MVYERPPVHHFAARSWTCELVFMLFSGFLKAYNCHSGYSNWYFGWSVHKKNWCCGHAGLGCPGTWQGSYHFNAHMVHGVGHAHGRIYDCGAGFSNWMQGWSDSKKVRQAACRMLVISGLVLPASFQAGARFLEGYGCEASQVGFAHLFIMLIGQLSWGRGR